MLKYSSLYNARILKHFDHRYCNYDLSRIIVLNTKKNHFKNSIIMSYKYIYVLHLNCVINISNK